MKKVAYTTQTGAQQWKPGPMSAKQYFNCDENYRGFCLNCGATRGECEPDARKYECPKCKQPKVYGIQELFVMGLVEISLDNHDRPSLY